jgi:hypothetical protein
VPQAGNLHINAHSPVYFIPCFALGRSIFAFPNAATGEEAIGKAILPGRA